ncbi:FG-GAP-like repeat-containing protein [Lewinella sp. 4G2]|uniref:FG-GAP-like repeat-containing protein n=1 Tax=Lewinella sp. 4G2 TaxID=1803372 RepID=UPI0007B475F8|nr:FG-GAP-like repeat-containing protein [Lewinella sp. 4G2]OAV43200.1 hypothetical protein A3850_001225 [Lewinella sp. 4G2]
MSTQNTHSPRKRDLLRKFNKLATRIERRLRSAPSTKYSTRVRARLQRYVTALERMGTNVRAVGGSAAFILTLLAANPVQAQQVPTFIEVPNDVGYYSSPAYVDIDGDGDQDLVAGNFDGNFILFTNDGSGNFIEANDNPFGGFDVGNYANPSFADIDGDGDEDLISGASSGEVIVFSNDGNGAFSAGSPLPGVSVNNRSAPSFVDIDDDGDEDLVVGEGNGNFSLFIKDGTGTFITAPTNPFSSFDVGSLAHPTFFDIDGDEHEDLISGNLNGEFLVFLNDGNNIFSEASLNPLDGFNTDGYATPTFADIDGDGDQDLVSGNYAGIFLVFSNDGSNNFTEVIDDPLADLFAQSNSSPTFFDLDGDGDEDLVSGNEYGELIVFSQDASGAFNGPNLYLLGGLRTDLYTTPTFVDIDGDMDQDLVSGGYDGRFDVFLNDGSNTFVKADPNPLDGLRGGENSAPAFVDVDGDGDLDLVSGNAYGTFVVFTNGGTNGFSAAVSNPFDSFDVGNRSKPTFVDIDGDGDQDLVSGARDGSFKIFYNDGMNVFTEANPNPLDGFDVGSNSTPTFVDIDGDGDQDLVSGNSRGFFRLFKNITGVASLISTNEATAGTDFGSSIFQNEENGATITYTVTNDGGDPITNLTVVADNDDFTVSNLSATTLAGGESATFDVQFTPGSAGIKSAGISVTTDEGAMAAFDVTGEAVTGTVYLEETDLYYEGITPAIQASTQPGTIFLEARQFNEVADFSGTQLTIRIGLPE